MLKKLAIFLLRRALRRAPIFDGGFGIHLVVNRFDVYYSPKSGKVVMDGAYLWMARHEWDEKGPRIGGLPGREEETFGLPHPRTDRYFGFPLSWRWERDELLEIMKAERPTWFGISEE